MLSIISCTLRRKSIKDIIMLASLCTSPMSSLTTPHAFTPSMSSSFQMPSNLTIKKVVLIIRHGDRAQISRGVGSNYPETDHIAKVWSTKLPSSKITTQLKSVATFYKGAEIIVDSSDKAGDEIYAGWDYVNSPYGMLTALGSKQLQAVGLSLRDRYKSLLLSSSADFSSSIYCRSTNMCRTILSLKSLLLGLLPIDHHNSNNNSNSNKSTRPQIVKRFRTLETLYPQADGACAALSERRNILCGKDFLADSIVNYRPFESKMKYIFGYKDKVNWLEIKEVMTCHLVHGISLPLGMTADDVDKATEISGFTWGALYNDDILNRMAIGRFLRELLIDITHSSDPTDSSDLSSENGIAALNEIHADSKKHVVADANMLIYSGHDSTLVPVLCALGIYNNEWPPYASYLALEIAEESTSIRNTANDSSKKRKWVRAIYNDEEMLIGQHRPIAIPSTFNDSQDNQQQSSPIVPNSSSNTKKNCWYPYDKFIARLESMTISNQEYSDTCKAAADTTAAVERAKLMNDEIRATIGRNNSSNDKQ